MTRVGIGYDVHALGEGAGLVLGGVSIPWSRKLVGHSDADVLIHALCDALLGALGERDIGQLFPDRDPRWKGAPSRIFLEEAARRMERHGAVLANLDATIVAQEPPLNPHIPRMRENLAGLLGASPSRIGIKATTHERIGSLGRGEGIAALAVAALEISSPPAP